MSNRLTSPIPNDTREALQKHDWQIDNIALLLNKYLDFFQVEECINPENECFITIKGKSYKIRKVLKNTAIKNINFFPVLRKKQLVDEILKKILDKNKEIGKLDNEFLDNLKSALKALRKKFIEKNENINKNLNSLLKKIKDRQEKIVGKENMIKLTTQSCLVVGLGSGSVLETSIKLHHIYGIPYIPASAIKGVLRAYRIWKLAQWDENRYKEIEKRIEENKPDSNEEKNIIKIFGNQQQKGKLIFFDAYPEDFKGFDVDIMNPHYPEYYNGDEPPADWQNPRPITFLTIPEGTKFIFFFKNLEAYDGNILEDLREAFLNIGIGGKTFLGYGILE